MYITNSVASEYFCIYWSWVSFFLHIYVLVLLIIALLVRLSTMKFLISWSGRWKQAVSFTSLSGSRIHGTRPIMPCHLISFSLFVFSVDVTALMDCCHSGTVFDLPYRWVPLCRDWGSVFIMSLFFSKLLLNWFAFFCSFTSKDSEMGLNNRFKLGRLREIAAAWFA